MEININYLYNNGFKNIIDIRSNDLYNLGSIPNSINIPKRILLLNPELYLKKDTNYYLYCDNGTSSKKVSNAHNELGYNTYSIKGGYLEYKNKKAS